MAAQGDRGGPGCAGEPRQICHCVDDSGKLHYLESRYLELGVKRSLPGPCRGKQRDLTTRSEEGELPGRGGPRVG